ncbi:MAG TPA: DUF262 domain-containing protein [Solirubrobacteraceae bacterium]
MPFDSPDVNLGALLEDVHCGKIQLPDFQREWKWDDDRIASLLASISVDHPVGVLMMLELGGSDVRFKPRPVAGVSDPTSASPERLLLDGQQRVTSLYQALRSGRVVDTTDARGKRLKRWYYVDIARALDDDLDREDVILSIPEDRVIRSDFGRVVDQDLSSVDLECRGEAFPLARVFDMGAVFEWQNRYVQLSPLGAERAAARWNAFYERVLRNFIGYTVPVIVLKKETPKEAVCTVFEKVNTGGVVLNVFELLTATFAADDFRLNEDWRERKHRLNARPVLQKLESTDFLQAVALVTTWHRRNEAQSARSEDGASPAVSCRRKDILKMGLADYLRWAEHVTRGFEWAAQFLAREKVFDADDVPYRTQLVPLAALRCILGGATDEYANDRRLRQWYWCGVLGELYSGAVETRFARDIEQVPAWIDGGTAPRTVSDAAFEATRLLSLRTRNSAAYKGVHALLMKRGARDWLRAVEIDMAQFFDLHIDVHHIFPRKWCDDRDIDRGMRDSIVNKTPLSYDTNRSIGGRAPSSYVRTLDERVGDDVDAILEGHLIEPDHLRSDQFEHFFESRFEALVELVGDAMGKPVARDDQLAGDHSAYDEELDEPPLPEEVALETPIAGA